MSDTIDIAQMEPMDAACFVASTLDSIQYELDFYQTKVTKETLSIGDTQRLKILLDMGRNCLSDLTDMINEHGLDALGFTAEDANNVASLKRKFRYAG